MHGGSIGRLAELVENRGLMGQETYPGEDVQMQAVVLATNQEEQVGRLGVGRAKMDLLHGATEDDERFFKQVRLGHAGMRQGKTAGHAGGTKGFASFETGDQLLRVVQAPGGFRQGRQFVQDGGLGLGRQSRCNEAGQEPFGQERLAGQDGLGVEGGFAVVFREALVRQAEEALRGPEVDFLLGKDDAAAAFLVRNLVAFDALRDVIRGQMQILRDSVETENLIGHNQPA